VLKHTMVMSGDMFRTKICETRYYIEIRGEK